MSGRRPLRRAGEILRPVVAQTSPGTLLADVQAVWALAAGPAVAAEAEPVSERDGVVVISCRSAVWAQELELLQDRLRERLNEALGGPRVRGLRLTADAARHDSGAGSS